MTSSELAVAASRCAESAVMNGSPWPVASRISRWAPLTLDTPTVAEYKPGMNARRIAAFLLIVFAAICVSFVFHNHATDQEGDDCGICQILQSPGDPVAIQLIIPH